MEVVVVVVLCGWCILKACSTTSLHTHTHAHTQNADCCCRRIHDKKNWVGEKIEEGWLLFFLGGVCHVHCNILTRHVLVYVAS